jgi:hypothetical protein
VKALLKLANTLDDQGKPSMTVDNIRRELITLKARHSVANDNQPGRNE